MENNPSFTLSVVLNGEKVEYEATPDNTALYKHIGALAMYDHAFTEVGGGCTRIWRHDEHFSAVEKYMVKGRYPIHKNLTKVALGDIEAYDGMIQRQLGDLEIVPEDWSDEA